MKRGVLTNARRRRSFFINRPHEVTAHPTFSAEQLKPQKFIGLCLGT